MSDEDKDYDKSASGKPLTLEARDAVLDGRLYSPSTGRNKDAVRKVFLQTMPQTGHCLEIASGTGEHGAHIIAAAPELHWTYSDIDPGGHASQAAWAAHEGHDRLHGPLHLDVTAVKWGEAERAWAAMFCANMIHIAPFEAAEGLIAGVGRLLPPGGRLFLYGPFARNGEIAPSNARFSEDLKRRDPSWGVRDLDVQVMPLTKLASLRLAEVIEMPANNLSVIFEKL